MQANICKINVYPVQKPKWKLWNERKIKVAQRFRKQCFYCFVCNVNMHMLYKQFSSKRETLCRYFPFNVLSGKWIKVSCRTLSIPSTVRSPLPFSSSWFARFSSCILPSAIRLCNRTANLLYFFSFCSFLNCIIWVRRFPLELVESLNRDIHHVFDRQWPVKLVRAVFPSSSTRSRLLQICLYSFVCYATSFVANRIHKINIALLCHRWERIRQI